DKRVRESAPTLDERRVAVSGERPAARPSAESSGGRYELGAELGRGGIGRVGQPNDTLLGHTGALKEAFTTHGEALRRVTRTRRGRSARTTRGRRRRLAAHAVRHRVRHAGVHVTRAATR